MSNRPHIKHVSDKSTTVKSMIILALLYFIFGLVSWVNTILIPYFELTLQLSRFESYLVTFAFYIAYLVMVLPSSYLLNRIGYKRGMMYGLWCMALGALLFVPAAYWRMYQVFLLGLFLLGVLAMFFHIGTQMVTLATSIQYAGIWPLSIKSLGRHTNLGFALLVMALSCSAVMPIVYNAFYEMKIVSATSFEAMKYAYWIFIPCFAYIVWFAVWGYRIQVLEKGQSVMSPLNC
ncbi:MAG: MFS transporter [Petrimonas sp.]|jgi:FHS family L-fucose permease-like MFS transporter